MSPQEILFSAAYASAGVVMASMVVAAIGIIGHIRESWARIRDPEWLPYLPHLH